MGCYFFRHVLHKEFGKVEGVVQAKCKPYIPVVLFREEIETILQHLEAPEEAMFIKISDEVVKLCEYRSRIVNIIQYPAIRFHGEVLCAEL